MTRQQRFLLGLATGSGALAVALRAMRNRHAIYFEDRVVVITGGSRGLGLVIARQLCRRGRAGVPAGARPRRARARARTAAGRAATSWPSAATSRRAEVAAAIDTVARAVVAIDVLINNAGVIQVGPLEHMTHDDFENAMATHFWGPLHMMYAVRARRCAGAASGGSSTSRRSAARSPCRTSLPYSREQVRAGRTVGRRCGRNSTSTASASRRCPRADADRQPDERGRQGAARARVRVVRDLRFAARPDDVGRACRAPDHRRLSAWGSRVDAHRAGETRREDESARARDGRARDRPREHLRYPDQPDLRVTVIRKGRQSETAVDASRRDSADGSSARPRNNEL